MKIRNIVLSAILGAILLLAQVILSFLPNIELVTLLIIFYTLSFPKKITVSSIYIFAVLEGVIYGFGIWWIMYLYIWPILMLITILFQKNTSYILWAIIAAAFGLSFGAFCSIPYLFIGGPSTMFAFWVSGIPFDIAHCLGNFLSVILLLKPLRLGMPAAIKKFNNKASTF